MILASALLDAPTAFHPQVAAQRDSTLEAEEEVLAGGLDDLEALAIQPLRDVLDRGARIRRLDA